MQFDELTIIISEKNIVSHLLFRIYSLFYFRGLTIACAKVLVILIECSSDPSLSLQAKLNLIGILQEADLNDLVCLVDLRKGAIDNKNDLNLQFLHQLEIFSKKTENYFDWNGTDLSNGIRMLTSALKQFERENGAKLNVLDYSMVHEMEWSRTSCLSKIAFLQEKDGEIVGALSNLRHIVEICIRMSSMANQGKTLIQYISSSQTLSRWSGRLVECIQNLSRLYIRLGNRQKAEAYAKTVDQMLEIDLNQTCSSYSEIVQKFSIRKLANVRLKWILESYSGNISHSLISPKIPVPLKYLNPADTDEHHSHLEFQIESIQQLLSIGDEKMRLKEEEAYSNAKILFNQANLLLQSIIQSSIDLGNGDGSIQKRSDIRRAIRLGQLQCSVAIRLARCHQSFDLDGMIPEVWNKVRKIFEEVRDSKTASGLDKAYACYRLGRMYLSRAKKNGLLQDLWENISQSDSAPSKSDDLFASKVLLRQALTYVGLPTSPLSRKILRCLALCTGPRQCFSDHLLLPESIILMHRSIGGAHRNSLVSNLSPESQMRNILQNMDGTEDEQKDFFDLLNKHLPEEWNIVGISVCPTGELLFSSIRKCGDGNVQGYIECIFSKNGQQIDFRKCLVQKMNIILQENSRQLTSSNAISKSEWWRQRQILDQELKNLLLEVDSR